MLAVIGGIIFVMLDNQSTPETPAAPAETAIVQPTVVVVQPTAIEPQPTAIAALMATDDSDTEPDVNNAALGPQIPENATLFIPSAGIYSTIVQAYLDGTSWDVSRLGANVGHLQGTSWVADGGNVVLSGHVELADGRKGVFANLGVLQLGDVIEIASEGYRYRYIVTEISSTTPDDLTPIIPTANDRLTLITCDDYSVISNSYAERTIIVAEKLG